MVLQTALGITRQDGFPIGLAAVDDDPLGPAVPLERLAQEPLGSGEVTPFAEPELDGVTMAVDGAVKVHPSSADLDVRFIDVPLSGNRSLAGIEVLQKFGRVPDNPSVNGCVVDRDTALS